MNRETLHKEIKRILQKEMDTFDGKIVKVIDLFYRVKDEELQRKTE